jgi:asparagine synthase (glutamine-hydrolysing)
MHQIAVLVRLADSEPELLRVLNSKWNGTGSIVLGARSQDTLDESFERLPPLRTFPERAMLLDLLKYLPDNHMVKLDRASMAVGLETRAPFLDHRIVEFAFRLPLSYKIRNGSTKDVLRRLLYRYVPPRLVDRKKMGFPVPVGIWLRGPLREWAEALIDERGLRREGYLDPAPIRRKWSEHLAGSRDWSLDLWRVLMFQEWLTAH